LECWQTSAYSFYRPVRGNLRLGLTVPRAAFSQSKSNDSIELSTGCHESLGAGLALQSGRTQAFHLYRYFTDLAFGADYQ
jgi:hypothetical protein